MLEALRTTRAPAAPTTLGRTTIPRRVPLPRTWPVRASDVVALAAGNAVLVVAMWVRHGGLDHLGTTAAILIAAGQVTALLGTYLALLGIVLMSRAPWLDQVFGMDRLAWAHRWIGFGTAWLLVGHAAFTTIGYALDDGSSVVGEAWTLLTTFPYVLMAAVALGLFVMLAVSSVRAARGRVSRETWYGLHLYAYLAVALGFAHQLAVGADFVDDPVARAYWIGLYAVAALLLLVFRVGQPFAVSLRHRLRVERVVPEGPGVVSIYVTGRDLDRLPVRAGQFFWWRFLTRDGWWRAHPFSLSAAPNGAYLRLTVKELGDWSGELQRIRPGTRVFVEGPYGILTGARRTRPRVLLVAGGIGIAPLRALVAALPAGPGDVTLVYRASRPEEVVLRGELDRIARERGATVHYLVGRRGSPEMPGDPLDAASLGRLVPDVRERDVFLCGPEPMMAAVRRSLGSLRVPAAQVHFERFAF